MKNESRCPECGYSKLDAQTHMDHYLCKNAGNAPWEQSETESSGELIVGSISVDTAIDFLNEALRCDPQAIKNLILTKVDCNATMANHPTIQCGKKDAGNGHEVGPLGLINGLFGTKEDGWGYICAIFDDTSYTNLLRFERTPDYTIEEPKESLNEKAE